MPTVNETRGKLIGFAFLPVGWHYNNEGVPAKEQALKIALSLLGDLEDAGFRHTDAYPGVDGSVLISAYELPDCYDFSVKPSGLVTVAHERDNEDLFYEENMGVESSRKKIKEFGASKWRMSGYLTLGTTTAESLDDLRAMPSETQKTAPAFQLSRLTAPEVNPGGYVNIAPGFTLPSQVRQPSSGKSRKKLLQVVGV